MLTYYNSPDSPNCLKTKIVLAELEIDYDQKDFTLAQLRASDFSETFPNAKVPAIDDDGVLIAESSAIALYLAEKHGRLMPTEPSARALAFQALGFEASLQAPVIGGFGIFGELGKPEAQRDMARVGGLMPEAQRIARVLGAVLGDREYFAGEYSVADIQLWAGATKAIQYDVFKDPPANLLAWDQRMAARPAVKEVRHQFPQYRQ